MTQTDQSIDYSGFSSLPQVDQAARAPHQRRPRFDGDVSELPDRACWALQQLLTRRYLSAESDRDLFTWVLEYRAQLSVRLSELDLLLRIVDGADVAFVEQARYESARGVKLLRREPLGTYDSILALHLAQMMRASGDQAVLISRDEVHGLFSGVLNDIDRDAVTFTARIDAAIARLTGPGDPAQEPRRRGQLHRQPGDHRGHDGLGDRRTATAVRAAAGRWRGRRSRWRRSRGRPGRGCPR